MMPKKKKKVRSKDITWNLKNELAIATMTFCLRTFPTGQVFTGVGAPEGEKACEDMGAAGSCDGCGCVAGSAAFGSSFWGAEVMSQGCRVRS